MPAADDEVAEAEEEGIVVNNSWGPKEILTENGKVTAVVFKKCISVLDENQRFSPKYDEEELLTVPCDQVLLSIGQSIKWGALLEGTRVEFNPNGTLKADPVTTIPDQDLLLMLLQQEKKAVYLFTVLSMKDRALLWDVIEDSSLSWIKTILKLRPLTMQNVRCRDIRLEMQSIPSVIYEAPLPRSRYRRKQTAA